MKLDEKGFPVGYPGTVTPKPIEIDDLYSRGHREYEKFKELFPEFAANIARFRYVKKLDGIVITFTDKSQLLFYFIENGWHLTTEIDI